MPCKYVNVTDVSITGKTISPVPISSSFSDIAPGLTVQPALLLNKIFLTVDSGDAFVKKLDDSFGSSLSQWNNILSVVGVDLPDLENWRLYPGVHRRLDALLPELGIIVDILLDSCSPISLATSEFYYKYADKLVLLPVKPKIGYSGAGDGKMSFLGVIILQVEVDNHSGLTKPVIFAVLDKSSKIAGARLLIGNYDIDANKLRQQSDEFTTRLVPRDQQTLYAVSPVLEEVDPTGIYLANDRILKGRGKFFLEGEKNSNVTAGEENSIGYVIQNSDDLFNPWVKMVGDCTIVDNTSKKCVMMVIKQSRMPLIIRKGTRIGTIDLTRGSLSVPLNAQHTFNWKGQQDAEGEKPVEPSVVKSMEDDGTLPEPVTALPLVGSKDEAEKLPDPDGYQIMTSELLKEDRIE